VIAGSNTAEV